MSDQKRHNTPHLHPGRMLHGWEAGLWRKPEVVFEDGLSIALGAGVGHFGPLYLTCTPFPKPWLFHYRQVTPLSSALRFEMMEKHSLDSIPVPKCPTGHRGATKPVEKKKNLNFHREITWLPMLIWKWNLVPPGGTLSVSHVDESVPPPPRSERKVCRGVHSPYMGGFILPLATLTRELYFTPLLL